MSLFRGINISASGLTAQRLRMNIVSSNIANVNTTRTEEGGPYQRKMPVFKSRLEDEMGMLKEDGPTGTGVVVEEIKESKKAPKLVYNPQHPDANEAGYVKMPNINIVSEMTDMISATRSYEANVTALNSAKQMAKSALKLG
ncbi:flagellar basal-body rod protein FlgC [Halobacteroides halobius DSM 5150]|uniref:Flagellar basal-body rod protein FlgC n=1 Tax=Halobacteroides halobius (strain ATCC 35273 / DSM 5150 / MD-1) TaxID=748449 RepID=L0K923_HALHC|nr:flagellar basal body rod protein FlgC [Halobacteroides halobius]AGB40623.1 flagellar basal-body rod protein FlgC [Halobacteroides halobius DSM 5150]